MKLSRLILLVLPVLLLASCGGTDPKKPENPSSTSASTSVTSSTVNPYVRHLTLEEVVATFESAQNGVKKITNVQVKDNYIELTRNSETGNMDKKEQTLTEVSTLYTNSVIFSSYTAAHPDSASEYQTFGKYDATYGPKVEQYIAFNDSYDKINTIDVYSQIGESNKKNIVTSVNATLEEAEIHFNMLDSRFALIDPASEQDKLVTFAVDTKGYYDVVYKNSSEIEVSGTKKTTTIQKSFKFQSGQLFYETTSVNYKEEISDVLQNEYTLSYSAEFTYSSNGEFDRSKLPGAN